MTEKQNEKLENTTVFNIGILNGALTNGKKNQTSNSPHTTTTFNIGTLNGIAQNNANAIFNFTLKNSKEEK